MSCVSGKRSFRNKQSAIRGLLRCRFDRRGRLKRNGNRHECGVYQCQYCGRWHMSHLPDTQIVILED